MAPKELVSLEPADSATSQVTGQTRVPTVSSSHLLLATTPTSATHAPTVRRHRCPTIGPTTDQARDPTIARPIDPVIVPMTVQEIGPTMRIAVPAASMTNGAELHLRIYGLLAANLARMAVLPRSTHGANTVICISVTRPINIPVPIARLIATLFLEHPMVLMQVVSVLLRTLGHRQPLNSTTPLSHPCSRNVGHRRSLPRFPTNHPNSRLSQLPRLLTNYLPS